MELFDDILAASTILIVDDTDENVYSLTQLLKSHRYKSESANSGEEALKKVLKKDYALILLDTQMPGMNGYEVAEALKGLKKTMHIPIIFLTAMCKEKSLSPFSESGAIDYVLKPFDFDLLKMKINSFLRLSYLQNQNTVLKETLNRKNTVLEPQSSPKPIPQ